MGNSISASWWAVLVAGGVSAAVELGSVSAQDLALIPEMVAKGQYWRLVTNLTYFGPPSPSLAFNLIFLYNAVESLRKSPTAVHRIVVGSVILVASALSLRLKLPFLSGAMVSMLTSLWALEYPDNQVSLWGFPMKAKVLPVALVGLDLVVGNNPAPSVLGFAAALFSDFLFRKQKPKPGYLPPRSRAVDRSHWGPGHSLKPSRPPEAST